MPSFYLEFDTTKETLLQHGKEEEFEQKLALSIYDIVHGGRDPKSKIYKYIPFASYHNTIRAIGSENELLLCREGMGRYLIYWKENDDKDLADDFAKKMESAKGILRKDYKDVLLPEPLPVDSKGRVDLSNKFKGYPFT